MAKSNRKKNKPDIYADYDTAVERLGRALQEVAKRERVLEFDPLPEAMKEYPDLDKEIVMAILIENLGWPAFLLYTEAYCKFSIRHQGGGGEFTDFVGNVNVYGSQLMERGLVHLCADVMLAFVNFVSISNERHKRGHRQQHKWPKKLELSEALYVFDYLRDSHVKLSNGQKIYNYVYNNWVEDKSST